MGYSYYLLFFFLKSSRFLLPLHQRIQLIKVREGRECTTKRALEMLQQEGELFPKMLF